MLPKDIFLRASVNELMFSLQAGIPASDRVKICTHIMKRFQLLLNAAKDAKHTLENTTCDEPGWSKGSIDLLNEAITQAEGTK